MLGKISLSISLKMMWVGNANTLPLFAYIFLHNLQTTVVISKLDLLAGPSLTFLNRKKSHTQNLVFPGKEKSSSSWSAILSDAMTVQQVILIG